MGKPVYKSKKAIVKTRLVKYSSISILIFAGLVFLAFYFSEVENQVTPEDEIYIEKIMGFKVQPRQANTMTFNEQVKVIHLIQDRVLLALAVGDGIPKYFSREPKDLYQAKMGLCYDRSRTIEKICRLYGFRVRHVALFSTKETRSALRSLFTPQVPSHAFSEVFTNKGWLVVESNCRWTSLSQDNEPVSLAQIQADVTTREYRWHPSTCDTELHLFREPFVYIYGLYSRHGYFYPPFNFIPDINWGEFLDNFWRA